MGKRCAVPFCASRSRKSVVKCNVSFHEFPVNMVRRNEWLNAIRRQDYQPDDRDCVCSIHFQNSDFMKGLKIHRLSPYAVPSIFPNYPSYLQPKMKPKRRQIKRATAEEIASFKKHRNPRLKPDKSECDSGPVVDENEGMNVEFHVFQIDDSHTNHLLPASLNSCTGIPFKRDVGTQANGLWEKIQELYKTIRDLKTNLNKKQNKIENLTENNKKLQQELDALKSVGKSDKKQANDSVASTDKLSKIENLNFKETKEPDLSSYFHPRVPRSLSGPKSVRLAVSSQKRPPISNHLNQVIVCSNKGDTICKESSRFVPVSGTVENVSSSALQDKNDVNMQNGNNVQIQNLR